MEVVEAGESKLLSSVFEGDIDSWKVVLGVVIDVCLVAGEVAFLLIVVVV